MDALGVQENSDSERFHNIIVNLFDVILEYTPMFIPHAIPHIKPNTFLKLYAIIH